MSNLQQCPIIRLLFDSFYLLVFKILAEVSYEELYFYRLYQHLPDFTRPGKAKTDMQRENCPAFYHFTRQKPEKEHRYYIKSNMYVRV
jgi:hypothetical protein